MTRRIKIITTNGISGTIETNVSNLGELKPLLRQRDINYEGMKLLIGETKNELSEDVALLPENDFKLYMVPAKTKSGGIDDSLEEIDERLEDIESNIAMILSILSGETPYRIPKEEKSVPLSFEDMEDIEDFNKIVKTNWD